MAQATTRGSGASLARSNTRTVNRTASRASSKAPSTRRRPAVSATSRRPSSAANARKSTSRSSSRRPPQHNASRRGATANGHGGMDAARERVAHATGSVGRAVGSATRRARGPLVAGGAALAGMAGGAALSGVLGRRRPLAAKLPAKPRVQIRSRDLAKTAKQSGSFGQDVGSFGENLASLVVEVRQAREAVAHRNHRRSPIEVVLDGLTARR